MASIIQLKRGRAATWQQKNLLLLAGEPGFETDTGRLKIGNGTDRWNDLPYVDSNASSVNSGVFNAATKEDFPSVGDPNVIYKAEKEKTLYQWNTVEQQYEAMGSLGDQTYVIYGGDADDYL